VGSDGGAAVGALGSAGGAAVGSAGSVGAGATGSLGSVPPASVEVTCVLVVRFGDGWV
jgi:hypothetical protein